MTPINMNRMFYNLSDSQRKSCTASVINFVNLSLKKLDMIYVL